MNTKTRRGMHTQHQVVGHTLVIRLGGRKRVLSSAPLGGGFGLASSILNHQVEANGPIKGHYPTPARYLRKLASQLRLSGKTIGLMTAVPMTQLVTAQIVAEGLWVECFATVGVTNAVRAGEWHLRWAQSKRVNKPGTINLIVITNASLSNAAMVGAVQVVTEAKTSVLMDHAVKSTEDQSLATGTGTDAVVMVGALRGQGPPQQYSGTHTVIGTLIGKVVARCVARGLAKAEQWQKAFQ
ncbi:MAG: adenosylcobinamide amidohydrolase [Nitrospira sp.]|nr:adenosylcobinamide amidohydrolase [Nitrospira sp.]MDH5346457.1 adenosylcobinamide amidohydrolase [Nitrospira sp.]